MPTPTARDAACQAAPAPLQVRIREAARLLAYALTTNGLGRPASGMNAQCVGTTGAYQLRRSW